MSKGEDSEGDDSCENISLESLLDNMSVRAGEFDALAEQFVGSLLFYDKSLAEWLSVMFVEIPERFSTPDDVRQCMSQVVKNYQLANQYYSISAIVYAALETSKTNKKAEIITEIIERYSKNNAKRPASTIITSLAEASMNDSSMMQAIAKIYKDFWRQQLDTLTETRKKLEQIAISMTSEMKYLTEG